MKKRKLSMRTWIFVLFTLFLLVIELTTELGGRRATGLAFIVFAGLKIAEFAWETFATVKQERNEQDAEESAAVTKLDEMKSAGLIDEKEYQKRKNELAGK